MLELEESSLNITDTGAPQNRPKVPITRPQLRVIRCTEQEVMAHQHRIDDIDQASGGKCLWNSTS
jgi:DNA polymerase-3 subunit epsilon